MVSERLPLPALPPQPARTGLPLVATLAPLGLAVVLWLVTSSPYALLFALLGPVVAVAGRVDGRRQARRARREALAGARASLVVLERELGGRAAARRRELDAQAPGPDRLRRDPAARGFRIGTGDVPLPVELVGDVAPELAGEVARLRERASVLTAAPVVVDDAEFAVAGPEVLRRAFARGLVLQALARAEPGGATVAAPPGEQWLGALPFPVTVGEGWHVLDGDRTILRIAPPSPGAPLLVELGDERSAPRLDGVAGFRPALLAAVEAEHLAERLLASARAAGWRAPEPLPGHVDLGELLDASADTAPSCAVLGVDANGPVGVDLEADGPHALVTGTTGAGKSELLVSWVLALAARRPPDRVSFLLVDFKGGAAFAPLAGLPHVTGVVSDLDEATAERAIRSLRAEIRRRETVLAEHGVRELAELADGTMPRLVVVVDEFAALIAAGPELQQVFVDLAARGRSLGLHLLLGTQRPTGVVRDAVLANVTVRLCLRVLEPGESTAMVGVPDAAQIPVQARGRGLLRDSAPARAIQVARASPQLAEQLTARWADHPRPAARPWVDPLPAVLNAAELPETVGLRLPIGLVDRPELQRHEPLAYDPWRDGALLVLGASGSGRSTTLATLAAACGERAEVRWIDAEPAELWDALATAPRTGRALVLVDDLDLLLGLGDLEQQAELGERLTRATRELARTGIAVAASARGAGGRLAGLGAAFEQRILLRLANRDEHLHAGGEPGGFRAERRPGSGLWRGHEAQLVRAFGHPEPWRAPVEEPVLQGGGWAVVAGTADAWRERLAGAGIRVVPPGPTSPVPDGVVVGDVDAWLADPRGIAEARSRGRLLLTDATRSELRVLTRCRQAPPLAAGEAWLVDPAGVRRARVST